MSYKTNFTPKVLKVHFDRSEHKNASGRKETSASTGTKDIYVSTSNQDPYIDLVSGTTSRPETRQHPRREAAIQDILAGLTMPQTKYEHVVPYVPDLEGEIFKLNPEQHNNMTPVLQRYVALEKVINAHIAENKKTLDPRNMSQLTADQIADLWNHQKALEQALLDCKREMEKAKTYHLWERQNKAAEES